MYAHRMHEIVMNGPAKNALGKWFALQFEDLGWTTPMAEYQAAKEFNRFVEGGTLRIAAPTADAA